LLVILGKSHSRKAIRPWQYSIFVQTLLLTIASRLGTGATNNVMEAWVNLFAYVMHGMLPHAIKGQVNDRELNINTADESKVKKAV
jgi:hemoglobin-like flavoprotein